MSSSLKNLLDSFIDSILSEKSYSENTARAYYSDLEEFLKFLKSDCAKLKKDFKKFKVKISIYR